MSKLDRYILRSFIATLFFSLVALNVIFVVVDLMEKLDKFIDHKATIAEIGLYYVYFLPQIIKLIFAIAMLLASLFSVGRLSSSNEITAMKSAGQSLYRLMLPIVIVSILLSLGQLYFNGWIVPRAQTKMLTIDRQFLSGNSGNSETQIYNLYFRDNPRRNVIMASYDEAARSGFSISIEDYSSETTPRLERRLDATHFRWDSVAQCWSLLDGYERITKADGRPVVRHFEQDTAHLRISHSGIMSLQRTTDEMNLDEYRDYINMLENGGKDVRMKRIDYYGQYAFPFANLIVVLFGVPFASIRKKSGVAVEIATAMVVAFSYLVFTKISQSIGFEFDLSPVTVGWAANGLFLIIAAANLWRTKT